MKKKEIEIIEKSFIVATSVVLSILICRYLGLSEFFAGIVAIAVTTSSDMTTRKKALERVIATICGGIIACAISYAGFQENMTAYLLGLALVCTISEFIFNLPSGVACIVFTYIMLNINPSINPKLYVEERVLATIIGAIIVSIVITIYNKLQKRESIKQNKEEKKNLIHHIEKGIAPGIAVVLGFLIISSLDKFTNLKYFTNYTLFYSASASIVIYHIDIKQLLYKSKERILSTILGGIVAFIFNFLNLSSLSWLGIGIVIIVIAVESFIGISSSLAGVVFLFIMVNMKPELTPLEYYIDRVLGTILGAILIIFIAYILKYLKNKKHKT